MPTNEVVATCVVLVPAVAVGAVGVPVSAGDARGAYVLRAVAFAGVNPSAVVTSELWSVTAPVRVLNESTEVACAGMRTHVVLANSAISPTTQVLFPSRFVDPDTLTL